MSIFQVKKTEVRCDRCEDITCCAGCNALLFKSASQERIDEDSWGSSNRIYFCFKDAPKWDIRKTSLTVMGVKVSYYLNNVECAISGVPLKIK